MVEYSWLQVLVGSIIVGGVALSYCAIAIAWLHFRVKRLEECSSQKPHG